MERILNIKVDLKHPENAINAIKNAVANYKNLWSDGEIETAKNLALRIMAGLCEEGQSIIWNVTEDVQMATVTLHVDDYTVDERGSCYMTERSWNVWIAKCMALCEATHTNVPQFITDKVGECW